MSGCWRRAIIGVAAVLGAAGAAQAADLYGGGGMKDHGYRPVLSHPATWYLRLDTGYALHDAPVMVSNGTDTLSKTGIDSTWTFGGGIGRYVTQNVRADLTADYRFDTDVHGRNIAAGATIPGTHRFGLESTVLLANLYYDLNRGGSFNPYLGAGLGTVHHQVNAGSTLSGATIGSSSDWSFAGALMAGFTVAVHDRLSLDAGYRFLYLGETKAGDTRDLIGNVAHGPTVEDIYGHEFRLGLRWDVR